MSESRTAETRTTGHTPLPWEFIDGEFNKPRPRRQDREHPRDL